MTEKKLILFEWQSRNRPAVKDILLRPVCFQQEIRLAWLEKFKVGIFPAGNEMFGNEAFRPLQFAAKCRGQKGP